MKHFELTVADHTQNGFHALAIFPSKNDEDIDRDFKRLGDLFPEEEMRSPDDDHNFLIDIRNDECDILDQVTVPMQFAVRVAKGPVELWQKERPNPDEALVAGHRGEKLNTWPLEI